MLRLTKIIQYDKNEINKENFDAIIIGSGIGGLVTASQLAAKGAQVLVLENILFPEAVEDLLEEKAIRLMLELL